MLKIWPRPKFWPQPTNIGLEAYIYWPGGQYFGLGFEGLTSALAISVELQCQSLTGRLLASQPVYAHCVTQTLAAVVLFVE